MKSKTIVARCLLAALVLVAAPLAAQREGLDLAPAAKKGQTVTPVFEGWSANPDGTYTFSFGYFNRNTEQVIEVPLGPDNRIEPAEYDGMQPTHFAPVNYGGYNGRRERGAFAVTVPGDFADREVVWTLRVAGEEFRIPARTSAGAAYELSSGTMAMGSAPPVIWFAPGGRTGYGPTGVLSESVLNATVGQPVAVSFFASDERSNREDENVPLGVTFWKHQGPGEVAFAEKTATVPLGSTAPVTTTATFSEPGDYMLRIRVDNHRAVDSSPGDQCCWSNGYVRVRVTP